MPEIFNRQLYDEWYASLSEEAKQRLAKKVQKKREKEYRELQQGLRNISTLATAAYQYRDRLFHVNQRRDNMAWMAELKRRHWYCICGLLCRRL